MCLYFIKKSAKNGRFSVLGSTYQGQKGGSKTLNNPLSNTYIIDFQ
jgi:hypothetical protein